MIKLPVLSLNMHCYLIKNNVQKINIGSSWKLTRKMLVI